MAEIIGVVASGFTIASLFKVCLDAIDLIKTAQHQDLDVKKLVLKLNIEKCRLYAWGEALGLTTVLVAGQPQSLDACPEHIQCLVGDTLDMIISLFMDTQKLKDRYGCKEIPIVEVSSHIIPRHDRFGPIDKLAVSFSQFRIGSRSQDKIAQLTSKTRWIINDRKKFIDLVAEIREFIDGLQDLTQSLRPADQQEGTVRHGVQRINDVETLDLIADVCELDHPAIADAASERSTVISSAPPNLRNIEQWTSDVLPGPGNELAELESLTVTELKHRILAHADERARIQLALQLRQGVVSDRIEIERVNAGEDAVSIRLISVLTMLYLPASFVATFFMWNIPNGEQIFFVPSNTIWTISTGAIPLSVSVVTAFFWLRHEARRRRRQHEQHSPSEKLQ